ncbi:MAG TPA: hypothetical protein VM935_08650, partial [Chitinophagaceae bacterium]|nr:hypothetical protein [Chitinophagaceae bacterium]
KWIAEAVNVYQILPGQLLKDYRIGHYLFFLTYLEEYRQIVAKIYGEKSERLCLPYLSLCYASIAIEPDSSR